MRADHFASLVEDSGGQLEIKDIEQENRFQLK